MTATGESQRKRTRRRARGGLLTGLGLGVLLVGLLAPSAGASRTGLTTHEGNVTTCAGIGLGSYTTYTVDISGFSDGPQGDGTLAVNIDFNPAQTGFYFGTSSGIVHAVVVKGGPGYNKYLYSGVEHEADTVSSPLNPGGNVAQISHAFICYSASPPPTTKTTSEETTKTPGPPVSTEGSTPTTLPEETTTSTEAPVTTLGGLVTTSPSTAVAPVTGVGSTAAPAAGQLPRTGTGTGGLAALGLTILAGGPHKQAPARRAVAP